MTPTEAKLKAVRNWSKPQNVRDIRSFLSFTNYYRRFVQNFVGVVGPRQQTNLYLSLPYTEDTGQST